MLISKLYKKHVGEDIYVVGTGPTGRLLPSSFFNSKTCIGLNQAYKQFNLTYSITVHPELEVEYCELAKVKATNVTKWIVKHKAPTYLKLYDPTRYVFHTSTSWDDFIGKDPDKLFLGRGIQQTAIDIAVRMGAANVILVGVDMDSLGGDHHGHDQHVRFQGLNPKDVYKEYRLWAYKAKKLAREKAGVNVLSLSPLLGCGGDIHQEDYVKVRKELGLTALPAPKDISNIKRKSIDLP